MGQNETDKIVARMKDVTRAPRNSFEVNTLKISCVAPCMYDYTVGISSLLLYDDDLGNLLEISSKILLKSKVHVLTEISYIRILYGLPQYGLCQ